MQTLNQIIEKLENDKNIFLHEQVCRDGSRRSTENANYGATVYVTHPKITLFLAPTSEMRGMDSYEAIAERVNQFMDYVTQTIGTRPNMINKPKIGESKSMTMGIICYDAEIARGTLVSTLTTDDPFVLESNPDMKRLIETGNDSQELIHKRGVWLACYPTQHFADEAIRIISEKRPYHESIIMDVSNLLLAQTIHR